MAEVFDVASKSTFIIESAPTRSTHVRLFPSVYNSMAFKSVHARENLATRITGENAEFILTNIK